METIETQLNPGCAKASSSVNKAGYFVSIDSEHTRDVDDAFSIEAVPEGVRIQVAIANASAHVSIDSPEDVEARRLAASAYAGDRVLHRMLPRRISEGVGSLTEGEKRKAVVFDIVVSEHMEVLRFVPAVRSVKVRHRLSYDGIPAILSDESHPLKDFMSLAANFARAMLDHRRKRGALALYDLATMMATDEDGNVQQLRSKGETIGYIIVQELMILTNAASAPFLIEHNIPCVFRNHEAKLAAPPVAELAIAIEQWVRAGQPDQEQLRQRMNMVAGKAKYEPVCRGHYALNLPAYGHFTSPLRRYSDLVNQRQLVAHLAGQPLPYSQEALAEMAGGLNEALSRRTAERSEGFKKAVGRAAGRALERGQLSSMADHELCAAIKISCVSDEFPESLSQEIVRRAVEGNLADKVFVCIVFDVDPKKVPLEVRQALVQLVSQLPGKSVSLVMMNQAENGFVDVVFDAKAGGTDGFTCTATARLNQEIITAHGSGKRKRDAEQGAALQLIAIKLEIAESSAESVVQGVGTATQSGSGPVLRSANPKGDLLELCTKNKWKAPIFVLTSSGPAHMLRFSGSATLDTGKEQLEVSVPHCGTKKLAEALASELLIERISTLEQSEPLREPVLNDDLLRRAAMNSTVIGALQEVAQELRVPLPNYETKQIPGAQVMFLCELTTYHSGEEHFTGTGTSKQQAKVAAGRASLAAYAAG